ncbi:MAG: oligosaccharide flippase family protein [Planctomycetes bacterium]|nr:oligosaccharide flippase family protein [Planctomycetota bacterium]
MTEALASGSVFSGVRWSAAGQALRQGIRAVLSIVLARLIAPSEFGLLAMANVVINFLVVFQYLGTNAAIIQKKEISRGLLASVATLNLAMGVAMSLACLAGAPAAAGFYGNPRVGPILRVLGLSFAISSVSLVPNALLTRGLNLGRLVTVELFSYLAEGGAAVVFAALGAGVWALVAGSILGATVKSAWLLAISPVPFRLAFRWGEIRGILRFSLNLTAFGIFNYFSRNTDSMIIGKRLGDTRLGYYSYAYSIYMYPVDAITRVLMRVLFPAFARLQDDDARLGEAFLRANGGIACVTFPLMTGLAVTAGPLVAALLGARWLPIVPLLTIFAPIGMLQSIASTTGHIYLAKGRSDLSLWWGIFSTAVIVGAVFAGLRWGIVGVASAYAIAMVPLAYLSFWLSFHLIRIPMRRLFFALAPYVGSCAAMAGAVFGCRSILERIGLGPAVVAGVCVPLGAIIYGAAMFYLRPPALLDMIRLLPEKLRPRWGKGSAGPALPDVGIIALVNERWEDPWHLHHQLVSRLARYFRVVWMNPAEEWRDLWLPGRRRTPSPCDRPRPAGLDVYRPGRHLPLIYRPRAAGRLTEALRLRRARRILTQRGCEKIIAGIWRPAFGSALDLVAHDLAFYLLDDEYTFSKEEKPVSPEERTLLERVDQVFITSPALMEKKGTFNPHTLVVPNGVDYQAFASPAPEPADLAGIPRPRMGYAGVIKIQIDWDLIDALARRHPDWSFVLVGRKGFLGPEEAKVRALGALPNVHFLGAKSAEELPAYVQHVDVAMLCYAVNDYTKYIYPLKLHEYFAAGRPVVGSPLPSILPFRHLAAIATTPEEWSRALADALAPDAFPAGRLEAQRAVAREHDWGRLAHRIARTLCERLSPAHLARFDEVAGAEG